jgi:hypothetical protein
MIMRPRSPFPDHDQVQDEKGNKFWGLSRVIGWYPIPGRYWDKWQHVEITTFGDPPGVRCFLEIPRER